MLVLFGCGLWRLLLRLADGLRHLLRVLHDGVLLLLLLLLLLYGRGVVETICGRLSCLVSIHALLHRGAVSRGGREAARAAADRGDASCRVGNLDRCPLDMLARDVVLLLYSRGVHRGDSRVVLLNNVKVLGYARVPVNNLHAVLRSLARGIFLALSRNAVSVWNLLAHAVVAHVLSKVGKGGSPMHALGVGHCRMRGHVALGRP